MPGRASGFNSDWNMSLAIFFKTWWKYSRCENSARAAAGGTDVVDRSFSVRPGRRLTLRSATGFSQRENHHPAGDPYNSNFIFA